MKTSVEKLFGKKMTKGDVKTSLCVFLFKLARGTIKGKEGKPMTFNEWKERPTYSLFKECMAEKKLSRRSLFETVQFNFGAYVGEPKMKALHDFVYSAL